MATILPPSGFIAGMGDICLHSARATLQRTKTLRTCYKSFIKIFTSLDSFKYRGEGSLKAWMAKITLNEILKFVRNNSRLPIDSIDDKDMNIADGDSMETEDIPTDVLHQFIRELPDGYRTVFNLYVIDDKNHKEIAQLLGIKENTSASQLHKAKSMLAQKIKHYRTINSI